MGQRFNKRGVLFVAISDVLSLELVKNAGVVVTAISAIVVFFSRRQVKRMVNFMTQPFRLTRKMDELMQEIQASRVASQAVLAELRPNGGSTIRDAISRIESGTQANSERMVAILQRDTTPAFETDASGEVSFVNRAYINLAGRQFHELLGHGWVLTVHTEDRAAVRMEWDEAIRDVRAFESRYRVVDTQGHIHNVIAYFQPMYTTTRKCAGFIGSIRTVETPLLLESKDA